MAALAPPPPTPRCSLALVLRRTPPVVAVEMDVEVATMVEAASRRWCVSALRRWYAGDEAWLLVEKGMPTAMVRRWRSGGDLL
jgi:hypothetical protein